MRATIAIIKEIRKLCDELQEAHTKQGRSSDNKDTQIVRSEVSRLQQGITRREIQLQKLLDEGNIEKLAIKSRELESKKEELKRLTDTSDAFYNAFVNQTPQKRFSCKAPTGRSLVQTSDSSTAVAMARVALANSYGRKWDKSGSAPSWYTDEWKSKHKTTDVRNDEQ